MWKDADWVQRPVLRGSLATGLALTKGAASARLAAILVALESMVMGEKKPLIFLVLLQRGFPFSRLHVRINWGGDDYVIVAI